MLRTPFSCRMDVDQAARSNAQEYFGVKDPDYYEFEGALIFVIHSYYSFKISSISCKNLLSPFTDFQHMYLLTTAWKKTKIKTDNATDL